ncbi:hypothetical protein BS78_09G235200 [Paspalum vaginatum]|nr:hypothetical protein BS78_09G235200 [Paspalum vaginatum]
MTSPRFSFRASFCLVTPHPPRFSHQPSRARPGTGRRQQRNICASIRVPVYSCSVVRTSLCSLVMYDYIVCAVGSCLVSFGTLDQLVVSLSQ